MKLTIEQLIEKNVTKLKDGESAVTIFDTETVSSFLVVADKTSKQIMAVTEPELKELYKILQRRYEKPIGLREKYRV